MRAIRPPIWWPPSSATTKRHLLAIEGFSSLTLPMVPSSTQSFRSKRHDSRSASRGHTPVPNWLFDEMPTLEDTEFRLLLLVVRQTRGWQDARTGGRKERDWITRSQRIAKTGRNSVARRAGASLTLFVLASAAKNWSARKTNTKVETTKVETTIQPVHF